MEIDISMPRNPVFNIHIDSTIISFPIDVVKEDLKKTLKKTLEKSSEKSSEKILNLIEDNPEISAEVLAMIIEISSRAVEKQIAKLKNQGKLERIGPDKGGYWKIIKK